MSTLLKSSSFSANNFINVLVVDDKQENLHTMKRILQDLPINIHLADSGNKALQQVIRHPYALIILDVQMPEMDGFELASILAKNPDTALIPIIFVSAVHRDLEYHYRGYDLGAVDYLPKPFDPVVLISKVNVFIKLYRHQLDTQHILSQQITILNSVNDGWWEWEMGSEQFMLSESFKQLLGYEPESLPDTVNSWQGLLLDDSDWQRHQQAVEQHINYAKPYSIILCFCHRQGHKVWVLARGVKLTDVLGKIKMIGSYTNISDIKRTEQLLQSSNHELEKYAYVAAHDLRAPLRGISSLLAWIKEDEDTTLSQTSLKHMAKIQQRMHRMEGLICGILDYSRVEQQKHEKVSVNAQNILQDVISEAAAEKALEIICDHELPMLKANATQLQQVFANLISNAIKYNDKEKITIHIGVNEKYPLAEFYVKDNGPGIADKYHEQIFELFQTLHARDKIESTGVGLTIVRKIIQVHGGNIWIDSDTSSGTCFRFTWPLAHAVSQTNA